MIEAAAYSRVSGASQLDGDGYPRQRLAIETYATANNIEVVRWYEEKAVSGKTEWECRPAWMEMVEELGSVRTIIIERLDRLARRLMVQENIIADLRKRGVTLISCAEPDLDSADPTRVLMRQIFGSIAEWERAQIVAKLRGARQRMKAKEGHCEGRKEYGFYEGERTGLALIRTMAAGDVSPAEMARRLNDAGVLTRGGGKWHGFSVSRIARKLK